MSAHVLHGAAGSGRRESRGSVGAARAGVLWVLLGLLGYPTLGADEPRESRRQDEASFKIIAERNIFNSNRSGRTNSRREAAPRPATRVESISLVGTMSYEKGRFAFFDGSSSQYRKTVKSQEAIGGCKVVAIGPRSVTVETGGKPIEIPVGMHLRREDDGGWELSTRGESSGGVGPGRGSVDSNGPPSGGAPSGSGSGGGEMSEVLKRLLEQREKEMK